MGLTATEEKALVKQVGEIHTFCFGVEGQRGQFALMMDEVGKQDKRIVTVERFMWVATGIGIVFSYVGYHFSTILNALIAAGDAARKAGVALIISHVAPWSFRSV
jgi:cytochrome c biogenesis protein CcdA